MRLHAYHGSNLARTQALTRNTEEGLVTMAKFPYVLSQHNCIIDYIPYLDAFEITRKVAVGDGYK